MFFLIRWLWSISKKALARRIALALREAAIQRVKISAKEALAEAVLQRAKNSARGALLTGISVALSRRAIHVPSTRVDEAAGAETMSQRLAEGEA